MKLFLLRSNLPNEGMDPRSLGNAPSDRLQRCRINTLKEYKPEKEGSRNSSVGDEWKEKTIFLDLDSPPLHPANDNI